MKKAFWAFACHTDRRAEEDDIASNAPKLVDFGVMSVDLSPGLSHHNFAFGMTVGASRAGPAAALAVCGHGVAPSPGGTPAPLEVGLRYLMCLNLTRSKIFQVYNSIRLFDS